MSYDAKNISLVNSSKNNLNQNIFSYESADDTFAAIVADQYFNNDINALRVGDIFFIKGSDASGKAIVTSVTTNVTMDVIETHAGNTYAFTAVKHTTVGGAASEDVTVTGLTAADLVVATLSVAGAAPTTLTTAFADTDKVTLTFAADPSNDHVIDIVTYKLK